MCSEKSWDILSFMSCNNFICIPWIYIFRLGWIQNVQNQAIKVNFLPKKCISCNVFVILSDISITLKVRFTFGWEFEVWNLTSLISKTFIVQFDIVVSDLNLHPYMFLMSIIWNHNQWVVCVCVIYVKWLRYGWVVGSKSVKHGLEMRRGWDVSEIWVRLGWYVSETWVEHGWDTGEMWVWHGWDVG